MSSGIIRFCDSYLGETDGNESHTPLPAADLMTVRFWDMIRYHRDVTCFFPGLVCLTFESKRFQTNFSSFVRIFAIYFCIKLKIDNTSINSV